jgi:hypothetical protein
MEASARRLGAAHLLFSSFALSQGLSVRKLVKPLERVQSLLQPCQFQRQLSLSFSGAYALYPALQRHSLCSPFLLSMPCRYTLRAPCSDLGGYYTAAFGGRCGRSPRFWNFLAFADRVAVRTLLYSRGKDACGHVCACGLCAELPITVKGMG